MSIAQDQAAGSSVVTPANRLAGKVALITGGTRGIGFAVAKAYAREGARLVIASRTGDELKIALGELKELGAEAFGTRIDLTSWDACRSLYSAATRQYGRIDVLVNNAAILGPRKLIVDYPVQDWDEVMRTNCNAVFWMSKLALGLMIPGNTGSIINVVSDVGVKGRAQYGAYAVSKAAVLNFTQVVAEEVKQYNVRVNCVDPGATRTMLRAEEQPKENPDTLPSPDDIVNPFIYLATDVSKGLTGTLLNSPDWVGRSF